MAKILVIDDDNSILEILRVYLTEKGYEVVVARDGKEGLAAARQEKPDMIILDVMMPEMDGFSVSGILFQDPVMRLIPVLILTAKHGSQSIFDLVPNVRLYMSKPFQPPEVLENVKRLLGQIPKAA
jgi:DNA-binding response OmpR family regulator